jgi:hypothetical protein
VALDLVLFAARVRRPEDRALVERRIAALERFYGVQRGAFREDSELGLSAGALGGTALAWGSAPPPDRVLLDATDEELHGLPTPLAAIALDRGRARIVTAAGGVASLYAARSEAVEAWSSHAAAAVLLAHGHAAVDPAAVAELVACEFTGGDTAIVAGARAVAQAARIDLSPDGTVEQSYWPGRWRRLHPIDAREAVEPLLLASLEERLRGAPAPVLGLTAGLDSRVVAVALRELGIRFLAFTHGDPDAEDARVAARVAAALGAEHLNGPIAWREDADGLARLHEEARWSDGSAPVGFGDVPWPEPLSHWVAGMGAETGRAFWYRWVSEAHAPERVLDAAFEPNLAGADPEVRRSLRAARNAWLERAAALGYEGLDALDFVYAEQRVRRWGRAQAPRLAADLVPAYAGQQMLRVLLSLPRQDRLEDGFQRRFLAARAPGLVPPEQRPSRGGRAPLARRLLLLRLRAVRRSLRLPQLGRGAPTPWHALPPWDERPAFIAWLRDEVLRSPLLADALGERWLAETRSGFVAGKPHAGHLALLAAAPVALEVGLRELRRAG